MSNLIAVTGNTFPVKDALKAMGARWNADQKAWMVSSDKAEAARKIVSGAKSDAPTTHAGKCQKCHGAVKAPYTVCFACKNVGKCLNCREPLNTWERQHGVKRCAECRDGGSHAHGGSSYLDRNGRFVLGDDD